MLTRTHLLLIATLMALAGSITAALATQQERDFQLRGYIDPTKTFALPFRGPLLGVNADLGQYEPDELAQHLAWMEQAGVIWVRHIFAWNAIEPAAGEYVWEETDAIVEAVAETDSLQLVAVLFTTPSWARDARSPQDFTTPPADHSTFADFAGVFATRYGDRIDYYQIWDEPNLLTAWGGLAPRAADYTALLSGAYQAVHSADPRATVIAAGLAPTVEIGPDNISDVLFLEQLYVHGAGEFLDAAAAKPYGFEFSPLDRVVRADTLNFSRMIALREVMVAHGDSHKALWASHWGWNALLPEWAGEPSIWGEVSTTEQVEFTAAGLDRAQREWPWVGGLILNQWQPNAPPDDPRWGFAVIDADDQPTALWALLAARPPIIAASNGLFPAQTSFARYSGVWTFSALGADIGWVEDSRAQFDFSGRDISLLLREDDFVAWLYPRIEGQRANAAPHDADGNPYILLTSDTLEPEIALVPAARGLLLSTYTLELIADELIPDEAQSRWPLIGYAVSDGDLRAPYNRQIAIAWLTAVAAAVGVMVAAWQINWAAIPNAFQPLNRRLNQARALAAGGLASVALMGGMLLTWTDAAPPLFRREPVQIVLSMLTAGLIYIEPGMMITLAAGVILFVLCFHRVELGLGLTLFWSPFFLFPVELYTFAFPIAEVILLITLAAWMARTIYDWAESWQTRVSQFAAPTLRGLLRRLNLIDFGVLAWVLIGALSVTWADRYPPAAVTELRTLIVEPALFYLMLRMTIRDRRTLLLLIDLLLLAAVIVCAIGWVMYVRGEAIITAEDGARRLASVYGSPNNVGLLIGRCVPFLLAFSLLRVDRRRQTASKVALALLLVTAILSQSVGALFIGIPAAITAALALIYRRRAVIPIITLGMVFTAALFLALQFPRFERALNFTEGTTFARIRVWQSAVQAIQDRPLTGLGLDQFLYAFRGQYILPDAWEDPSLSHPHNILLDYWTRLGLPGMLTLIVVQGAFWRRGLRAYQQIRPDQPLEMAVMVGILGSMINLLAHGLVDNSVFVIDLAIIWMFLLAACISIQNTSSIDETG
jgi:O-antigen ligase